MIAYIEKRYTERNNLRVNNSNSHIWQSKFVANGYIHRLMCGKIPEPVLEENGMRKLAPVLLSLLMMTAIFASIGWQKLEEKAEFENTSGRTGPDVEVVEITHPRQSTKQARSATLATLLMLERTIF